MIQSIGFIPDGNRRFAEKKDISLREAYKKGSEKAQEAVRWSFDSGIEEVVFWTLSTENLERNSTELKLFFPLLEKSLSKLAEDERIQKHGVQVKIVGELDRLPGKVRKKAEEVMEETKDQGEKTLYLGVGYGGREEILEAAKNICEEGKEVNEENFSSEMKIDTEPDLVIRTSGTKRLSGFMPWQTTYSELKFIDKLWPELTEEDLEKAVSDFEKRDRKFGR